MRAKRSRPRRFDAPFHAGPVEVDGTPSCSRTWSSPTSTTPSGCRACTVACGRHDAGDGRHVEGTVAQRGRPPVPTMSIVRPAGAAVRPRHHRLDQAGDLLGGLALESQCDDERCELGGRGAPGEHLRQGPARFGRREIGARGEPSEHLRPALEPVSLQRQSSPQPTAVPPVSWRCYRPGRGPGGDGG